MLTTKRESLALAAVLAALPVTPGLEYVTFTSKARGYEVRIGYSLNFNDEYVDPVLEEIWIGGADVTIDLADGVTASLEIELADAVRKQDADALSLAQEDRAADRQMEFAL